MPLIFSTKATKVLKTEETDRSEVLKKMVETGHKPGRAELYLDTHKKKDGSHVNEVAKEICVNTLLSIFYRFNIVLLNLKSSEAVRGSFDSLALLPCYSSHFLVQNTNSKSSEAV
ncbi:putative protein isoform X1 [Capsicum chacoense]